MQYQIIFLLFLLGSCAVTQVQKQTVKKLKFRTTNAIKQLDTQDEKRFDLSGIVRHRNSIYVIADKEWNNHLYKIDTTANNFTVTSARKLPPKAKVDYEGIDVCKNKYFIIEEGENDVYEADFLSNEMIKIEIPWEKYNIDRTNWGNKGFEGIAYDCKNEILYLAKERQPRRIYKVDLKTKVISEPFPNIININEQGYDITDMKFENGALYILERGKGLVTKINIKTNIKKSLSFHHIVLKNRKRLYNNSNPDYGMAEALLLTENEIWIGLDNNGNEVSEYGKSFGLRGNKPVILIFDRPAGF